ncbi:hypothetical protein VTJ04DRAFT_2223 [Mycothermus thermophilus]|uniref:uncharacterized protein n=1 Tax=Humicola insolens TaxID=85995 RepID=UPI0037424BC3
MPQLNLQDQSLVKLNEMAMARIFAENWAACLPRTDLDMTHPLVINDLVIKPPLLGILGPIIQQKQKVPVLYELDNRIIDSATIVMVTGQQLTHIYHVYKLCDLKVMDTCFVLVDGVKRLANILPGAQ